ncbi:MAG: type IX secretion system membrane protein PorP/SprF [Sphingobacteriales bacterium]|nr:MAG: type IX secretion system membrane protein PorP/SprF [Sphingobacteriales bacterium]
MGGLLANYNLTEAGEMQLIGGAYYRHKDAIIPMAGFELNNLRFTFSYDVTTSSMSNFNNSRGAMEFSLIKKGFYPSSSGRQSMCPTF